MKVIETEKVKTLLTGILDISLRKMIFEDIDELSIDVERGTEDDMRNKK